MKKMCIRDRVLTVLTGCGKNTGQTSRSTEKKEIDIPIILAVDPTSGKKTEQDVVDAFNEEYALSLIHI